MFMTRRWEIGRIYVGWSPHTKKNMHIFLVVIFFLNKIAFQFTITDNSIFFPELFDRAIFPHGFDVATSELLTKDTRIKSFSILSVGQYGFAPSHPPVYTKRKTIYVSIFSIWSSILYYIRSYILLARAHGIHILRI